MSQLSPYLSLPTLNDRKFNNLSLQIGYKKVGAVLPR